jgi:hypothetical protein
MELQQVLKKIDPAAMDEVNAANYCGLSIGFLRRARQTDPGPRRAPGPPFIRVGSRVLYLKEDLDTYLRAHRTGGGSVSSGAPMAAQGAR